MNRKETIERIQELVATEEINKCLEGLRQPITLAGLLCWEEDIEYENLGKRYKMINNKLYYFNDVSNKWITSAFNEKFDEFIEFQQAKKIQPKKYYLRLKEKYRKFYGITKDFDYLNFYKNTNYFFVSNSTSFEEYQAQFTLEEIEELKKIEYIPLEHFELIEVGGDD